jgi:ADP-ribose pyrophosphatase YjhB (NUDIX family)
MPQREYPLSPLVGVGAVVVDELGRVLLVKRGSEPRKGHWSIPGGLLELGELLIDAVVREVAEETGLTVKPEALVEVVDRIHALDDGGESRIRYHYVIVDYWCHVVSGEAEAASDAEEIAWISRAEWLDTNPYMLESIAVQVIERGWQMAKDAGIF